MNYKLKIKFCIVILYALIAACVEFISIYLVMPFAQVILNHNSNVQITESNLFLKLLELVPYYGHTVNTDKIAASIIFSLIVIISGLWRIYVLKFSTSLSAEIGLKISASIHNKLIRQDYTFYDKHNLAKLQSIILNDTPKTIAAFDQLLQLTINTIAVSVITICILFKEPIIFACFAFTISLLFIVLSKFTRVKLLKNSEMYLSENDKQVELLVNEFKSFVYLVMSADKFTLQSQFVQNDASIRKLVAQGRFLALFPRYVVEATYLTLIAIITFFISFYSVSADAVIATIAFIGLSSQKIVVYGQQIYTGSSEIRSNSRNIIRVANVNKLTTKNKHRIYFNEKFRSLVAENFSLVRHTNNGQWSKIFKFERFVIEPGDIIRVTGLSGSGKTSFINTLTSLLSPSSGSIALNSSTLDSDQLNPAFLSNIFAYTPQDPPIYNTDLLSNIHCSLDQKSIDHSLLKLCVSTCCLDSVQSRLGYQKIGDDGTLVSGGQKQRIAIARSLFSQKPILILDESTSAIDIQTEKIVLENISINFPDLAVVIITHRESINLGVNKIISLDDSFDVDRMTNVTLYQNLYS